MGESRKAVCEYEKTRINQVDMDTKERLDILLEDEYAFSEPEE